jgi:hypothetical protein
MKPFRLPGADYHLKLFQNFSFGTATLDVGEKAGRTLIRLDRFFREPVEKPWGFGTGSFMLNISLKR